MIGNLVNLKQLEALVWVADLGSFRRAAQQLNTTQPNISARIAALESTLNIVLMHRDAGSVRLTDKGAEILEVARRVLHEAEVLTEVAARADLVEGRLRLGVTELVAATWLHQYLRDLKETYPSLTVELTVDLSQQLDKSLGSRALDLTIQNAPFASNVRGKVAVGDYPYVWAASHDLALKLAGARCISELTGYSLLTHARHTQSYSELADHARYLGIQTSCFVPSSSLTSCMQMTADGLGVALLPRIMVERGAVAGRLAVLENLWLPTALSFAARYRHQSARHIAKAATIAAQTARAFGGHLPTSQM